MPIKKAPRTRSLDIDTAFKFVFRDKEWVPKVVVAGILYITLIGAIPVMGWALEIQRRAIRGEKSELPKWDDIGEFTIRGFKLFLLSLLWGLPIQIPYLFLFFATILFFARADNGNAFPSPFFFVIFLMQPVVLLITFAFQIIFPIITGLLAETNSVLAALSPRRVYALFRVNMGQFLGVAVLGYAAVYAASVVGFAALCIGAFFTAPIGLAISYQLYGQAYRNAKVKLGKQAR